MWRTSNWRSATWLAIVACWWGIVGPSQAADALEQAIDELVAKQGISADTPGVAICVVQPGRLHFQKGYGLANLKHRTPITPKTLFELASVSKTFTATAILMLHERGRLSIDDDVRKYLPELPVYRHDRVIRISDLMHHVSGLPGYMDFENVPSRHGKYWDNDDYLGEFARQLKDFPLEFPTGQKYEYNNTNYLLLASVITRVVKKSFGTFMHDEIFVPAGMRHSFVYESPAAAPRQPAAGYLPALGYEKGRNGAWRESWGAPPVRNEEMLVVGDGSVWSNLEDMALWDAALREHKLIKPATMKLALQPSKTRDGETNGYGLGWMVYPSDSGGLNGYGHEGSWGGFQTSYYRYLIEDRTTVILSNRGTFDADAFWYTLNRAVEHHLPEKK